jgi:hypothetical protein
MSTSRGDGISAHSSGQSTSRLSVGYEPEASSSREPRLSLNNEK